MLPKFKSVFWVLISSMLIIPMSCSFGESMYSCDPEVEAWTKANAESYASASREEIASLSLDRQRAIFRALSGEQKVQLWHGKLQSIMLDIALTDSEKQELSTLFNFLEPRHYDTKKGLKEIQDYATAWETKMRTEYNWTDEKLYFYTHTWLTKTELDAAILQEGLVSLRKAARNEDAEDCNCRYDSDCRYESGGSDCDSDKNCKLVRPGCGALNAFSCDGLCS